MIYDIFSRTAPAMPKPGKGTEIVKLLLSQVSKGMQEPILPMTLPALAAHVSGAEFKYPDNKYYELCGQMGHLIGPSGIGKDQLHDLIEAIMRSFRDHDEIEYKKLENWQHGAQRGQTLLRPVTRRSDGSYHPNFKPMKVDKNFSVERYISGVDLELHKGLKGLVGKK